MKHIKYSTYTSKLQTDLLNGTAIAVSDGSFYPIEKVGSCGWILASSDGSQWIQGGGIIPGKPMDQSSYRSELGGQLGIVAALHSLKLSSDTPNKSLHITTLCDGISALNTVGKDINMIKIKINTMTWYQ